MLIVRSTAQEEEEEQQQQQKGGTSARTHYYQAQQKMDNQQEAADADATKTKRAATGGLLHSSNSSAAVFVVNMRHPKFALFPIVFLILSTLLSAAQMTQSAPVYPELDPRLVDWPLPLPATADEPWDNRLVRLDCYNELDANFLDSRLLFHLDRREVEKGRACLIRIPTGSRIRFEHLHFTSKESTVTIVAGSSPVFLPLRTEDIHADEHVKYGPWHVPCRSAYLVFRPRGSNSDEWLQFRLSPETAEDREVEREEECRADATNFAAEYGPNFAIKRKAIW